MQRPAGRRSQRAVRSAHDTRAPPPLPGSGSGANGAAITHQPPRHLRNIPQHQHLLQNPQKNQAARRTRTSQTTQGKHGLTSGAEPAPAAPGAGHTTPETPAAVALIAAEADVRPKGGDV